MNISQAARATGLSAKQIRDYEKAGLLPPAERAANGYRRYGSGDLARLNFIRHAREVGFSLPQTAELLALNDDSGRSSRAVKALTAAHIAELDAQIRRLCLHAHRYRRLFRGGFGIHAGIHSVAGQIVVRIPHGIGFLLS